jgi:hypothetical protein
MELRARLVEALNAVAAAVEGPERVEHCRRAAIAAGWLSYRGEARGFSELDERARRTVRLDVLTIDLGDLTEMSRALRALSAGFSRSDERLRAHLREVLARRTELEAMRRGVSALLGHTFEWSDEQAARVRAYDDAAEEILYQLVAINDVRSEMLNGVAAKLRDELWWLSRGVELPPESVEQLANVATLVAQFPPARAVFDDRVRSAEQAIRARASGSTRRISRGFSLDAWIGEREEQELTLLHTEAVTLTLLGGDLLALRVRAPLRIGERPRVRTARAERVMEPVAGTRTQFELALEPEVRHAPSLSLVVPFADREQIIDVLRALETRQ